MTKPFTDDMAGEVTEVDRTRAERAKFQLGFMCLMLISDRTKEAGEAAIVLEAILDEMIEEGL